MLSELLKILDQLQGELFFSLADGPLKNRVVESYLEKDGALVDVLEFEHQASILFKPGQESTTHVFDCRLETSDFKHQIAPAAEDFNADEISELINLLRPFCPLNGRQKLAPTRKIIRKKKSHNLLSIAAAAKTLNLSHRQLKALIPCSETRIVEKDGTKSIEEFYWDKELIAQFEGLWLKQQNGRGYNREDLSVIAESCCDGDRRWASDCIVRFINQRLLKEN
jgi:hypothetical protein